MFNPFCDYSTGGDGGGSSNNATSSQHPRPSHPPLSPSGPLSTTSREPSSQFLSQFQHSPSSPSLSFATMTATASTVATIPYSFSDKVTSQSLFCPYAYEDANFNIQLPIQQRQSPIEHNRWERFSYGRTVTSMISCTKQSPPPPSDLQDETNVCKLHRLATSSSLSLPSTCQSRQQNCNKVTFGKATVVGMVDGRSMISMEERDKIWYQNHELGSFKEQAKDLCRRRRRLSSSTAASRKSSFKSAPITQINVGASGLCDVVSSSHVSPDTRTTTTTRSKRGSSMSPPPLPSPRTASQASTETDTDTDSVDSCRGMEVRVCIRRQRNKLLSERCILKAQSKNRNPNFIASISLRCTIYAKEVAAAQGMIDYCQVYYPHLESFLPKIQDVPQHPFPIKTKMTTESNHLSKAGATTGTPMIPGNVNGNERKTCLKNENKIMSRAHSPKQRKENDGINQHACEFAVLPLHDLHSSGMKRSCDDFDDSEGSGLFVGKKTRIDC